MFSRRSAAAAAPWAYGFVVATLAVVVLTASYLPARRAGRTDPLIALKGL